VIVSITQAINAIMVRKRFKLDWIPGGSKPVGKRITNKAANKAQTGFLNHANNIAIEPRIPPNINGEYGDGKMNTNIPETTDAIAAVAIRITFQDLE